VAGPPKRGISLPPSGWLSFLPFIVPPYCRRGLPGLRLFRRPGAKLIGSAPSGAASQEGPQPGAKIRHWRRAWPSRPTGRVVAKE
jgi:hypothetical protein